MYTPPAMYTQDTPTTCWQILNTLQHYCKQVYFYRQTQDHDRRNTYEICTKQCTIETTLLTYSLTHSLMHLLTYFGIYLYTFSHLILFLLTELIRHSWLQSCRSTWLILLSAPGLRWSTHRCCWQCSVDLQARIIYKNIKCKKLTSLQHRVRATNSHIQNSKNHFTRPSW